MEHQKRINPYVAGKPLPSDELFFGREDILEKVDAALNTPDNNVVVLFGQRRIGKTSILLKLERDLPKHNFFPISIDLIYQGNIRMSKTLYQIALEISEKVGISITDEVIFKENPNAFEDVFLQNLFSIIPSGIRPVFLIDEFDVLDQQIESMPEKNTSKEFQPYIQYLISKFPRMAFVLAIGRRMDELSFDFASTFKSARAIQVSVLNDHDARERKNPHGYGGRETRCAQLAFFTTIDNPATHTDSSLLIALLTVHCVVDKIG